ncbi:MAG: hypothetical protein ACREUS_11655 [Burkholderiales bacterium]
MGHAYTHDDGHDPHEHPVVAVIAIIAIVAAILLIAWARLAIHGTDDIEAALEPPVQDAGKPDAQREVEAAVTSTRFATGFSP